MACHTIPPHSYSHPPTDGHDMDVHVGHRLAAMIVEATAIKAWCLDRRKYTVATAMFGRGAAGPSLVVVRSRARPSTNLLKNN